MQPIGLYLHIPFCDGKCAYCNFFSRCAGPEQIDQYTVNLCAAIKTWGNKIDRDVDTVYFGGGTPSLLGHDRLINILDNIFHSFHIIDNAEITLEVNPFSANDLDFIALRNAGFNRLSIGLQSANDNELKILGRRHSADDAKHTVKLAQAAGFDNISLDVMLAVPQQTKDSLYHTIDFCAACAVQHISAYILKIEEGTRFYTQKERLQLFTDDEQAVFYEETVKRLHQLGYHQYEISNFSMIGRESKHNLHYWHDEEYLGLGPSAHSFINGRRFYFDSDFQSFYDNIITEESAGGDSDEYIMLALRLSEGIIFKKYQERFGHSLSEKLINTARKLEKQGLCTVTDDAISLTVKGFLVSNAVIAYLLENT